MGKRNLYLETMPLEQALHQYREVLKERVQSKFEVIPVTESLHRVTRHAVYAKYSSPLFNAAAMDGIAVIAKHTFEASERRPLVLREEDVIPIDTGDPVKLPFDAVIMAEDVIELQDGTVQIIEPAAAWQHIRPIGEDIVAGEMILPSSHKIRPIDIGVLLSAGITTVETVAQISVAVLPTGTELIEPEEEPREGSIIESNSRMFENMVVVEGAIARRLSPVADDYEVIKRQIKAALAEHDMVIINAGSSAGRDDYTVHILREIGEVIVHGVAIKPGKPVILAVVDNKPVIGLPGYPVSAYITFQNFVIPVLHLLMHTVGNEGERIEAIISKRIVSSLKHREYVRVKVGKVGNRMVASPLARGAGAAMSLVRADGFCVIEQNYEGVEAGETVKVELYRTKEEVEHTVVLIGSHDLALDILADIMPNRYRQLFVSSTHVGSMGGLMALKRREAHMAPIHLLDEQSGAYNIPYLKRIFQEPMILIKGLKRVQGFIVEKGNPLGIIGVEDLQKIRYVNRQKGAGTRILLDYKLKEQGISKDTISGYDMEMSTHMAVAALVKSGSADAGLGIFSAAKAMDLDFVEIGQEEYDFALPKEYLTLPHVQAFIEILKSVEFKDRLESLGGYNWEGCGEVVEV